MNNNRSVLRTITLFSVILTFILSACNDIVNKTPTGTITESVVWKDAQLVDSYLLNIYDNINFIGGTGSGSYDQITDQAMAGELTTIGGWQRPAKAALAIIDADGAPFELDYWPYTNIRRANTVIEKLRSSDFEPSFVEQKVGEARFLRAFMYFEMVKRFGGVPIVTKAQTLESTEEEIFVSRNTEKEVYDFIANELDAIIPVLKEKGSVEVGVVTRGAALALKSRAMLYAASIAEFGDIQMDGLLGIPSGEADNYWQASYDASLELINSGNYRLYNENSDPVLNFRDLFRTDISNNPEAIFGEVFDGDKKGHSFSFMAVPAGPNIGWGSNFTPFYNLVELFDFMDGSSGKIPRDQVTGQEWSSQEFFGDRDPRFRATIYYPEIQAFDQTIYFHSSTIVGGEEKTSGTVGENWPAAAPTRNRIRTGMLMRKRVNESELYIDHNQDNTDYIEFRLGEIYMNIAEAAFYLNKQAEALDYLNDLRDRANMPNLSQATEQNIRKERQTELALEGHRYWDLRRWRIAVDVLDGLRTKGLKYAYNYDTKKYKIEFVNGEGRARVFQKRHYYLPIGTSRIAENPNMKENPGY